MIDIIEPIMDQLVLDFGVSRTAAKIRMLDAGYEEALGAFIYIDGRYVKTHKATKGFLKPNQTFSVSTYDFAIMKFSNPQFRDVLEKGRYLYVDFNVTFHNGYENSSKDKQIKLVAETVAEENRFFSELPIDYTICLDKVMTWRNVTAAEIGRRTGLNEATVRPAGARSYGVKVS